jgi:hypothetical protein
MVSVLLSVTFACGVVIAVAHVLNRSFVAPVYDVVANLTAFSCAVAASVVLGHWAPALFSSVAIACWLLLARRTVLVRRVRRRSGAGRELAPPLLVERRLLDHAARTGIGGNDRHPRQDQ